MSASLHRAPRAGMSSAPCAKGHTGDPAELRPSGIPPLGDVAWGTHLSVFYETRDDLLETSCDFIEAGLRGHEFCSWAVSDPVTVDEAGDFLARNITGYAGYRSAGQIEILPGRDWYLRNDEIDAKEITGSWHRKLAAALAAGFAGMRGTGNAFWMERNRWEQFSEYERELHESLAGRRMIVLCTYSLSVVRGIDVLDVARAHHSTAVRRAGEWEIFRSLDLTRANQEIERLRDGMNILSNPFPGHELLTPRERTVLAQVVRGASSKEAARALGLSHRTVEFHRNNIMRKLGSANAADLVRQVLERG